ncbi:hypothetical protein Gotri_004815 [Gossypium trilobum]|uniref:Uncharacterized protein n=1 Tax=Gossypium trilobum TaxID=34281 RepID=A0A7J9F611_9ROSI|nr:hypothetical protein [Gossypium trilobum]
MADVTVRDETIFHLAMKNDMFEASKSWWGAYEKLP